MEKKVVWYYTQMLHAFLKKNQDAAPDKISAYFLLLISQTIQIRGCPSGVTVKAMDCGIVVSEFVFQSCYYVHFRPNTLGKGMNPLILPDVG